MIKSKLFKPLRKLSLLSYHHHQSNPSLDLISEQPACIKEIEQTDIISRLPKEIVLKIFSFLSFQDLIRVQLICRHWRQLTSDVSIWRSRLQELTSRYNDIYTHNPSTLLKSNTLSWRERYCQAITLTSWRMGAVQNAHQIDNNNNCRILGVKLKDKMLVTLTEDNTVKLYEYSNELGFQFKLKWNFGDPITQPHTIVDCIDILPEINILVVAQRGSKCMFYDINKGSKNGPIQVLKGGGHPWFIPDSISVNQDYFAVSGRKPSVVFVWNWRKGVKLQSKAINNQPHTVFLSGNNLITMGADGLMHVYDIFDSESRPYVTRSVNPCNIPCIAYDSSLSLILAPRGSRRIHHCQWHKLETEPEMEEPEPEQRHRRISFSNFLGIKSNTLQPKRSQATLSSYPSNQPKSSSSTGLLARKSSREFYKSVRIRRHSSYNDYGYACQMKTDQYIKQHINHLIKSKIEPRPTPDFKRDPEYEHSIRTTPLGSTAENIISVAMHNNRMATVNRYGDIAVYALNGSTAARVTSMINSEYQVWMDEEEPRDGDDLSDGYHFIRSRLAMGTMGIVYGSKNGSLWWLDFSCRFQ